jgi:hypothetical protein
MNPELNPELNLELSVEEVNTILAGLGELKAKTVMELIFKIRTQAQEQLPPPPTEPLEAP